MPAKEVDTAPRSDPEKLPGLQPGTWGSQPPLSTAPAHCCHPAPVPRGPGDKPAPLQSCFSFKILAFCTLSRHWPQATCSDPERRRAHGCSVPELQTLKGRVPPQCPGPECHRQRHQEARGTQASREEDGGGRQGRTAGGVRPGSSLRGPRTLICEPGSLTTHQ